MHFFDGLPASGQGRTQFAPTLDTKLSPAFSVLPTSIDHGGRSLADLNLSRAQALEPPSGEDVAATVTAASGDSVTVVSTGPWHAAPLRLWVLKEAGIRGGQHVGPVGGCIVAETLVGVAKQDGTSLRVRSRTGSPRSGQWQARSPDLLTLAGVSA